MARDTAYKTAEKLIGLTIRMTSERGITIPKIMEEYEVSRATAFRMKKSVQNALTGRAEFEVEPFDPDAPLSQGRAWTYKIYEADTPLVFNDVGTETLRALELAEKRLRADNFSQEAGELSVLSHQVNNRLQTRSGAGITAETLAEAYGVATRVSPRVQADPTLLEALTGAIVAKKPIKFRYYLRATRTHRTYRVDPLGVIFHRFGYLVCISHKARRDGPRTFRISEMDGIERLDGNVKNPRNFDLEEFADKSFGVYHGEEPLTVEWRFDPSVADEAEKFQFHPLQKTERMDDGSLLVKFTATGSVEMCWELFTWGKNVEIG